MRGLDPRIHAVPPERPLGFLDLWRRGTAVVLAAFVVVFLAAASAVAASPRSVPVYVEIKDWLAACDNTRYCDARGFSDEHPGLSMVIRRQAGPEGRLEVAMASESRLDPATLMLDGTPMDMRANWRTRQDDRTTTILATDHTAAAFLKAIRNGTILSFGPVKDATTPVLSLRGLAAVMLLMDDVQGRIGGQTALTRSGPATVDQVPPEPAAPIVAMAGPMAPPLSSQATRSLIDGVRASRQGVMAATECQPEEDVRTPHEHDQAMLLSPHEALVLLECFRGPYQSASLAFRVPPGRPDQAERVTLDLPLEEAPIDTFFRAGYDPATHIFTMKANGRGIGDCGMSASWFFDGKAFQLAAYAKQGRCGGIVSWPVLWRSGIREARP
ncbi:MAG: DUF1176 domain-containing protein [Alphaproteobacteria bacterium]|nr:DUF1176 domain-containing protein [Alphaproteobacteria bacterium]